MIRQTAPAASALVTVLVFGLFLEALAGGGAAIDMPVMVDAVGGPVTDHLTVNQEFYISANISNGGDSGQEFVYIVQITDRLGTVVLLKWFGGEVDAGQILNIAMSWVPTAPGTYTAAVFLWDGIHSQNALDSHKSLQLTVS